MEMPFTWPTIFSSMPFLMVNDSQLVGGGKSDVNLFLNYHFFYSLWGITAIWGLGGHTSLRVTVNFKSCGRFSDRLFFPILVSFLSFSDSKKNSRKKLKRKKR